MQDEELPRAVETREASFGGYTLRMHYLHDGQKVIEAPGMETFVRAIAAGRVAVGEIKRAMRWVQGDA